MLSDGAELRAALADAAPKSASLPESPSVMEGSKSLTRIPLREGPPWQPVIQTWSQPHFGDEKAEDRPYAGAALSWVRSRDEGPHGACHPDV